MTHLQVQYSWEHSISRIFGLFPYLAQDELGKWGLYKASDNPTGCYAQLMPDFPMTRVFGNGRGYISYRTMMKMYYKEIEIDDTRYNALRSYVERGLGRVYMNQSQYNTQKNDLDPYFYNNNYDDCDRIPPYFNLCMLQQTLQWYAQRRAVLVYAKAHPDEVKGQICCDIAEYRSRGGDCVYKFIKSLVEEGRANTIATEYYNDIKNTNNYLNTPVLSLDIMLTSSINDMGAINSVIEEWVGGREYKIGELVRHNGIVYKAKKTSKGKYDENTFQIVFDENDFDVVTSGVDEPVGIGEQTMRGDSARRAFKRTVPFIDEYGEQKTPEPNTDWLFYYRKGQFANITRQQDKLGNIEAYQETNRKDNLILYADVLDNIEVIKEQINDSLDEETPLYRDVYYLQFTYYHHAHLKANTENVYEDDDNNTIYLYSDFEFNKGDKYNQSIVKYVERKIIDMNDEEWIECFGDVKNNVEFDEDLFDAYVKGDFDNINDIRDTENEEIFKLMHNIRLPFNTDYGNMSCVKSTGLQDIEFSVEAADISYTEQTNYNGINYDYNIPDDYSMGTGWQGTEKINVFIERGNSAAFEKHVKLSEITTLTAMEEYANGGFFVMK